ncbi:tetratricopeptide repeat protein [Leptospira sp. WS39.C2]
MKIDGKKALKVLEEAREAKNELLYEKALTLYTEYLNMVDPSFTHGVWNSMAEILFAQNKWNDALTHCNKALEIMKDFVPALELRIKIQSALGNLNQTYEDQTKIKELEAIEKSKWDDPNHYYHYK